MTQNLAHEIFILRLRLASGFVFIFLTQFLRLNIGFHNWWDAPTEEENIIICILCVRLCYVCWKLECVW